MICLTRRYRFPALHRLRAPQWSDAENQAVYGKCANPHGHGHDYVLEVSVRGPVDAATGRVADPRALDRLVAEQVLGELAHSDLNVMLRAVPTTENLAREIRERLLRGWDQTFSGGWPKLERVRVGETPRNVIEITEGI